jgi:BirA family transcriptional regulator, biotin operon repressor / biotin---[acetyl-CoA-carboxylase] ligase
MEINCLHFECINSTNTWCKEHYAGFDATKITLVTAGQQLAGRGRFNRPWVSPAKQSIYATFTLFLPKQRKDIGNITQILALSAVKTLENKGFAARIKWPNDILLNNKKLGGILCETITTEKHLVVIIGIGINVNVPKKVLDEIGQPATSLWNESHSEHNLNEIIEELQNHFAKDMDLFIRDGFAPFRESFNKKIVHQAGDSIKINHQACVFEKIDEDGALIAVKDGREQKHVAGEVE